MRLHIQSAMRTLSTIICFLTAVSLAQNNLFRDYPTCSQQCLSNGYSQSPCVTDSSPTCVCENYNFLNGATACTRISCSDSDFSKTWDIAQGLCLASKANMTLFGEGTGRSSTGSSTSSSSPTSTASKSSKKLSNGALAGIVIGVVVGLTILAAGIFWFVHNWWTIEEVGPARGYGGELGYSYGPKRQPNGQSLSTRSTGY